MAAVGTPQNPSIHSVQLGSKCPCVWNSSSNHISCCTARDIIMDVGESSGYCPEVRNHYRSDPVQVQSTHYLLCQLLHRRLHVSTYWLRANSSRDVYEQNVAGQSRMQSSCSWGKPPARPTDTPRGPRPPTTDAHASCTSAVCACQSDDCQGKASLVQ